MKPLPFVLTILLAISAASFVTYTSIAKADSRQKVGAATPKVGWHCTRGALSVGPDFRVTQQLTCQFKGS